MQGSADEPRPANPHLGSCFLKHQQANSNEFRSHSGEAGPFQLSEERHQMPALELDQGLGLAATPCTDRPRDSTDSRVAKLRTPRIANSCPGSGLVCNSEGCLSPATLPCTRTPEPCLRHREPGAHHHHHHHHRARSVSFSDATLEWPITHPVRSLKSTQCQWKSGSVGHPEFCQPGSPCGSARQAKISDSHPISLPVSLAKPAQPLGSPGPQRQNKAPQCRFSSDPVRCSNASHSHSSSCPVMRAVTSHSYYPIPSPVRHTDTSQSSPAPMRHTETPPVLFSSTAVRHTEPTHSRLTPDTVRCSNMAHSHSSPGPLRHEQTPQPHLIPPSVQCTNKSHCHSKSGSLRHTELCRSHLSPDSVRCANTSHSHSMPTLIKHSETPPIPSSSCLKRQSEPPWCQFPRDPSRCVNASRLHSGFCPTKHVEPPRSTSISGPVRHTAISHSQPISASARCANTSHSHSAPALTKKMPVHQSNFSQDESKQAQRPQTAFSLIPIGATRSGDGQVR
ncbi:uncharacterized protein [Chiloscyllium punctatum]|uniref:uncharacterized protein n=1 Tax=Chiloscyllium punctatum TaxID=137246 RepID=UPI003B63D9C3